MLTGTFPAWGIGTSGTPAVAAVACPSGVESDFHGDGVRYTAITDPEATIDGAPKAGVVHIVHGGGKGAFTLSQSTPGIPSVPEAGDQYSHALGGDAETDDRFGSALAATLTHFAVGQPCKALGTTTFAGAATAFNHTFTSGYPKPLAGIGQDQDAVRGAEEVGDQLGTALAMVPYRASGATSTTESLPVVGVPGEDLSTTVDASAVQVFRLAANGSFTDTAWEGGIPATGVAFGATVR